MKKLLAFMIVFFLSFGLCGCTQSKDVTIGEVRLVSDGKQYEPLENLSQAYTHDVYSDGRSKRPQDVIGELSAISIVDDVKVTVRGRTKRAPVYTLYNERYQEVYTSQTEFSMPDEPGKYILYVGVTWGINDKEEYAAYQYFFLIEK